MQWAPHLTSHCCQVRGAGVQHWSTMQVFREVTVWFFLILFLVYLLIMFFSTYFTIYLFFACTALLNFVRHLTNIPPHVQNFCTYFYVYYNEMVFRNASPSYYEVLLYIIISYYGVVKFII